MYWIVGDFKDGVASGPDNSQIKRAILDGDVLKIDHKNPADLEDGFTRLRSKDGFNFEGSMTYVNDKKATAIINLKIYINKKNILMIGKWVENHTVFTSIIEMNEVKEFKD